MGRGEKVIKLILKFFIVGFFIGIVFTAFKSLAEEHPLFPDGVMMTQQVPIYCGNGPVVFSYASSIFKQKAIAWSDVKSSGDPNSETFAWVSFWYIIPITISVTNIIVSANMCLITFAIFLYPIVKVFNTLFKFF